MVLRKSSADPRNPPRKQSAVCPSQGEFIKNGRRYVRIVTHDYVRDLVIPDQGQTANEIVLPRCKLAELNDKRGSSSSREEDQASAKTSRLIKTKEAEQSALRKKELQSYPLVKEYGPRLTQLEMEAEAKSNFLLKRAKEIRQEDDDEVKLCNKLILGTKCQAIRDAQVAEKKTIEQELREEEKRLDEMMELERKKALAREHDEMIRVEERKKRYREAITEQVVGNNLEREMESERVIEEIKAMNEAVMEARIDELRLLQKKERDRQKMREEINRVNRHMLEQAEKERRESKLADLRIQEYMKRKAEEEEKREIEQMQLKIEREKELGKLRAKQQKAQDDQSIKDEFEANRQHEEYEKQWRRKEREVAERKMQKETLLKLEREKQMVERRKIQAQEAERERQELLKIEQMEEAAERKYKEEESRRKHERQMYKAALLKQINEREKERIETRKATFLEGVTSRIEEQTRDESLKGTIKRKIDEIRKHNVPEKYVEEIERQLRVKQ